MSFTEAGAEAEAPGSQSVEDVHRKIREAILDGELAAGEVMSQVTLARELGVSRTPLREALRMLQSEGLIESEPNRRVRVAPVSVQDVEELYTMRIPLEVTAIRLSLPQMHPEDLAQLEGFMAEMAFFAAEQDYERWHVPHQSFHRGLTAHAGTRFNAELGRLFDHAERYRRMHVGRSFSERSIAEHRGILDAVRTADRELAARRLADHLARSAFDIIEIFEPGYEPVALRQVLADLAGS